MKHTIRTNMHSKKGLTAVELIIVVTLIAILAAIALPSFMQWRQNLGYRATARDIASILRNARSRAISQNLQHRVEFNNPAFTQYRMTRGNRSAGSTVWPTVPPDPNIIQNWTNISQPATLIMANMQNDPGPPIVDFVSFNPIGTANTLGNATAAITIRDAAGTARFTVDVASTGRVSIRTGL